MESRDGYRTIEVKPLSEAVGAEIFGADLASEVDDEQFSEIRDAFHAHGVIFFREQDLTPEQQIAFARKWGDINVNRFFRSVDGYPLIAEVRKEPHHENNIGASWHTDHSYDTIPALGSLLYAREVPETGGDTQFASMRAAFDALSEGMKNTLRGMNAVHSSRHVFGPGSYGADYEGRLGRQEAATQDAVHPVVIRHPVDGTRMPVRQPGLHGALRRMDEGGVGSPARVPLPPRLPAGVHLPLPLAPGVARVLGQPRDVALRPQRLPGRAAPHAPHHHRGHAPRPVGHGARRREVSTDGDGGDKGAARSVKGVERGRRT